MGNNEEETAFPFLSSFFVLQVSKGKIVSSYGFVECVTQSSLEW